MSKAPPRHGDPFDYPDVPGDSGLGEAYRDATMSPAVKAAIAKRRLEKIPSEATAGRPGWLLLEHEGAVYRGFAPSFPQEIWSSRHGWRPYVHAGEGGKPVEWGSVISEEDALEFMLEDARSWAATQSSTAG